MVISPIVKRIFTEEESRDILQFEKSSGKNGEGRFEKARVDAGP
jgi:hypothetical protein